MMSTEPSMPALNWIGDRLVGRIVLPCWRGCGPGGDSDGSADLIVILGEEGEAREVMPEQVAAVRYLLNCEKAVTDTVLQTVFDIERYYPDLDRPEQPGLIRVSEVRVLDVARVGIAYVGFLFDTPWNFDGEDRFGLLMHLDRLVGIGAFEMADYARIARIDREREAT
jgi:hypothetical protein